jgi:hypothetical protein
MGHVDGKGRKRWVTKVQTVTISQRSGATFRKESAENDGGRRHPLFLKHFRQDLDHAVTGGGGKVAQSFD